MPAPTLSDLPAPPPGRTGWPWTEGSSPVDEGAGPWPTISVVVPSYKQAEFLEETLRSVLLQGYPALDLLVMDGGSNDGSIEIIRRYAPWIKEWVSEKDGGQSAAINKGWRRASGELLTWLNSDDLLLPNWAAEMAGTFRADPALDITYCDVQVIDKDSRFQWMYVGGEPTPEKLLLGWGTTFAQQGFLVRRSTLDACGYVDEKLHFTMDLELWLRLVLAGRRFRHVARPLGAFRMHAAAKTGTRHGVHISDMLDVTNRFMETAPADMKPLAERVRRRRYWTAAHICYDNRDHADARKNALRHLADDGWRALPRVTGMVALSMLGDPGHRLLALSRRLRAPR
jgi:glycosyltransferase involved in cell wall biosynthesis